MINKHMQPIIILGIDGLDPCLVKKFVETGIMPRLRKYVKRCFFAKMLSTIPPLTIPAWASLFTGLDQSQLQAYDMFRVNKHFNIKFLTNDIWRGEYLWDILSLYGIKMGVLFFPFLYNPYPINGFMITDPVLGKIKTYPPNLHLHLSCLTEFTVLHNILPPLMIHSSKKNLRCKMKLLNELEHKSDGWQVLFLQDGLSDISMHQGNLKDIIEAYSLIDELIGNAFEICESNNWYLLIVSDHGLQRAKRVFSIGTYFVVKGLTKLREISPLTKLSLVLYQFLLSELAKVDHKLSRILINLIKHLKFKSSRGSKKSTIQFYDISSTIIPYFSVGSNFANLWIGKILSHDRFLHDLSNLPIMEKIRGKAYCHNDGAKDGMYLTPLTLEFREDIQPEYLPLPKIMFRTNGFMHRKYATFIAYGPSIKGGLKFDYSISIIDFLPTLLAMLHVPIPDDRHGHIITEMFKSQDVIKIQYIPKPRISVIMKLKGLKKALSHRRDIQ